MKTQQLRVPVDGQDVTAILSLPRKFSPEVTPAIILAHGAGGGMDDPLLAFMHVFLSARGYLTMRFNFPYRERGRKAPDREAALESAYQAAIDFLRTHPTYRPGMLFVGGKSMGGRIASQIAARAGDDFAAAGLVLLAYPLHAPGRPERIRDAHLGALRQPTLFVSGTRDPLAPHESLDDVVSHLEPASIVWIEDGDHSFKMPRGSGRAAEDVAQQISEEVAGWLDRVVEGYARRTQLALGSPASQPAAGSPARTR
jgi:predicted alpha/beta-hydrolase family hydrolase